MGTSTLVWYNTVGPLSPSVGTGVSVWELGRWWMGKGSGYFVGGSESCTGRMVCDREGDAGTGSESGGSRWGFAELVAD